MRKIILIVIALFSLTINAQNLEHVFDMDKLVASKGFLLSQNNPNAFNGTTDVYLAVNAPQEVTFAVADVYGHLEATYTGVFESGVHQFRITLKTTGNHVMGAHQNGKCSSIVMICENGGSANKIEYIGFVEAIDPAIFAELTNDEKEEDFVAYGAVQSAAKVAPTDEPFRVALSFKDVSGIKFSTHIATVVSTPRSSASFFTYMAGHGYKMETAGISYYPSAPAMSFNKKKLLTKTVTRINKKCDVPVFIGEFSYPSQGMVGPFAGWNAQLGEYKKDQKGQADIYRDVIAWGKTHGLIGIRYWAPDYEGEWYPMSMFEFEKQEGTDSRVGTAKLILLNHKDIVE